MKTTKIIILDDHRLFCEGLQYILKNTEEFEVIRHFQTGEELIASKEIHQADLLILDINLHGKSGIEIAREIRPYFRHMKIVCLSMLYDTYTLNKLQNIGVSGFFPKEIDACELISYLKKIIADNSFHTKPACLQSENVKVWNKDYNLSDKEIEIITLLYQGKTNKEIAVLLSRSTYTIETHRKNIARKTNTHNLAELIKLAKEKCWLD
ncbi:response regulator transcription factor [Elizabethkingia sp. HX WHF]|uniref:response regulator transcription factor n=1 Tax=Elizabethkingia TaxID=308865 RepID=UPI000999FCE6|nr:MULTISPECIES: response regulator transcription factor [Elizabethkingia]ATL42869.1 DNA-binding response regulator [Elizabethkingia miricola]MCL1637435.1 response regulator transcription factor [Elizabethkingia bruuniana]MDX8563262.1 response regulator transcription factor [Elizabethkingia sp. HX WHF]OPC19806.1 hypothetical protein BAY00_09835 [Elizabethkingia bruuniana]